MCLSRWEGIPKDSSTSKSYIVSLFAVLFYIPFILLALMYTAILFKLKSQKIPGEQSDSGANEESLFSSQVDMDTDSLWGGGLVLFIPPQPCGLFSP